MIHILGHSFHTATGTSGNLGTRLGGARGLARQRRKLGNLDDRMLEDIGVTRPQAEAEANRPFWDAPRWWR